MGRLLCIYGENVQQKCNTYQETKQFLFHMHHLLCRSMVKPPAAGNDSARGDYIIRRRNLSIFAALPGRFFCFYIILHA